MNPSLLLAAKKIIEKELARVTIPVQKTTIKDRSVTIEIENAQVDKFEDYDSPEYASFRYDIACAYLIDRIPIQDKRDEMTKLFNFIRGLELGSVNAIKLEERLQNILKELRDYKHTLGTVTKNGPTKVVAFGRSK